jgi:2,4-dienoyl-CoA reductase-like NADH-dependent reductase (Old Yellow Enzyme family)
VLDAAQGIAADHALASDAQLARLQEDFLTASELAATAGFDGVDIKACHGYLVSELLAAATREESRFGGSFENRSRFLLETVQRIRQALPGFVVTSRINAFDGLPHPHGFGADRHNPDRADLSEAKILVERLEAAGTPILNVSMGVPAYNPHCSRPFNMPVAGGTFPDEHPLEGVARMIGVTAELQRAAPSLPMIGTGYSWLRQFFPHVAAAAIASGMAQLVGVGRTAFAYPDFARDLMEEGVLDPGKVCIACSGCSQIMRQGQSTGCVVRDRKVYAPRFRKGMRPEDGTCRKE